jgi:tRNA threonylcarbamoyladenosine biosynthesis protein TsaE
MEFIITKLEDLNKVAIELLPIIRSKKKVLLYGDMGAGKTTFTKAIALALGSNDATSSPTFSIANAYNYNENDKLSTIIHMDLYRIKNNAEIFEAGIEEYLYDDNITIIEWPQLIEHLLPDALTIQISLISKNKRKIVTL